VAITKRIRQGRTFWEVSVRGNNGERYSRTATTRTQARQIEAELLTTRDLQRGIVDATVNELAAEWWTSHVATTCKPSTQRHYKSILKRYIIPHLGSRLVNTLTPRELTSWTAHLTSLGTPPSAVNKSIAALKAMLGHHAATGAIPSNPAAHLKKLRTTKPDLTIPTLEQVHHLASLAPDEQTRRIILLLGYTGLRVGELLALRTSDVDLNAGVIHVRQALDVSIGRIGTPKTHQRRRVPLLNPAAAVLGELPASGYIFHTSTGNHLQYPRWRAAAWQPARQNAGLETVRLHDLRHTFASLCIQEGVDAVTVSRWMGHSTPTMTLNTYAHLFDRHERAAVERLNERLK
jgi:integrase